MNLKSNKYFFEIQDYLMILLGTLLYGFGFNGFILSNEIITGGLSGICALIYFASGQLIPVSISYFVINIILLAVALKILGLKFLLKTIFGVFSLSASLSLFEMLLTEPIIKNEPFMSIIIGGCLCGAGLGLVFSANGSTGGTDIIGAIVNKYKDISIGRALLFCDFFIIGSSYGTSFAVLRLLHHRFFVCLVPRCRKDRIWFCRNGYQQLFIRLGYEWKPPVCPIPNLFAEARRDCGTYPA